MNEKKETIKKNKKVPIGKKFKNMITLATLTTILLINPGCKDRNKSNFEYEKEKNKIINVQEQKENFSRLLYSNQETVNGKKYALIENTTEAVIKYDTGFSKHNLFDGKLKKTGKPHLTANKFYAYITYENNDKLALIDIKNEKVSLLDMK